MIITISFILVHVLFEYLHLRRIKRLSHLAFKPQANNAMLVNSQAIFRVLSLALLVWGLTFILFNSNDKLRPESNSGKAESHLIIALDVSPSMHLKDAGANKRISRSQRANEVLSSIFERIDLTKTKVSVIAFYTKAIPVVIDCSDPNVIYNIVSDLPLDQAFTAGKTDMYSGVEKAIDIAKKFNPSSSALMIVSDGDTLDKKKSPKLPSSIASTIVIGVGDSNQGKFIDGHSSKQNRQELKSLSLNLKGHYVDANQKHVSSDFIHLPKLHIKAPKAQKTLTEYAFISLITGSIMLFLISPILAILSFSWPPKVQLTTKKKHILL